LTTTDDLSPRQGKVLRYCCSKYESGVTVTPDMCIVKIHWSDMPKSPMQAQGALRKLKSFGLVAPVENGYRATKDGLALIKQANEEGLWRKPPPPSVTNLPRRKKEK
jgi:hypothetical protein